MLARTLTAWHKIKAWLRVYSPRILESLNPGASPEEVSQVEAALGHPLPMAMRCIYRCVWVGVGVVGTFLPLLLFFFSFHTGGGGRGGGGLVCTCVGVGDMCLWVCEQQGQRGIHGVSLCECACVDACVGVGV